MDDNNKNIEEEIRQFKLFKIQKDKAKIKEYEDTYDKIRENTVLRYTKNISSNILIILMVLLTITLFSIGVSFQFPEEMTKFMEENGERFSSQEKEENNIFFPFLGYFFIALSLVFGLIASLLKKNIRKRNTIYRLSHLVSDVIEHMSENVKEEKKRYEYYVDSSAEFESKRNTTDEDNESDKASTSSSSSSATSSDEQQERHTPQ